jgi:ATP-binding cassette, subfamily C, bacterial EexD
MATERSTLREALRACRASMGTAMMFSFFINLLTLTVPLYIMEIFQRVLISRSAETLVLLTVMALIALVAFGVLSIVRSRLLLQEGIKFDAILGRQIHRAMIFRSLQSTESRNVQELRDLGVLRQFLSGQDLQTLFDLPWMPIFIAVIWLCHPLLGITALFGVFGLFGFAILNDVKTRHRIEEGHLASFRAQASAVSHVRNAEVIEAMGMAPAVNARWRRLNEVMLGHQTIASDVGSSIASWSRTFRLVIQMLIFAVGAGLVIDKAVNPGIMMAAVYLLGIALRPIESAIRTWKQLLGAKEAYVRLNALLKAAPSAQHAMRLPAPTGNLSVEQLVVVPPGAAKAVLRGISFNLNAGQALGIVGPSAAGKSTLAKALVGVWRPTRGIVRLDGADVTAWDPDDLGQYVGYLPQDVSLFEGTVWENIARMDKADTEQIVKAAQAAGIHDMVLHLPDGYDTRVGEGGTLLSGGQRQRIGLARALYRSPRLIVLDEPNSNLDSEGEAALTRALLAMKAAGATIVVIAHRPSAVSVVDSLMVLKDGVVDLFGARDEVMAKIAPPRAKSIVKLVNAAAENAAQPPSS